MSNLKLMIKNEMEDDKSLGKRLAKLIGYSNPTPLYKFLNEAEREIDFQQVLSIVQDLFPDREFDIMSEYILTLKPTQRCARESLEYATLNRLAIFEEILAKLECCSNKESQEWASVYRIDRSVSDGVIKPLVAIDMINDLSIKTDEMKAFSGIAKFYIYNDLFFVDIMSESSYLIQNDIEKLKDGFIKDLYESRFIAIISEIYLHTDKVDYLRDRINELIGKITNNNLLNIMYVILGNSYIVEDYDKSYEYLSRALYYSEIGKNKQRSHQANKSINLINSIWNKKKNFIEIEDEYNSLLADKAFNKCNFSKQEGLEMLKQVDTSKFTNFGLGYYYYYLGVATGEEDYFFESIEHFNEVGEKFFKKLPLIELEKLGVKKSILKALSV